MHQTAFQSSPKESLGQVLESAPTGDSIVLLGEFNAHVGNDSKVVVAVTPELAGGHQKLGGPSS